MNSFFAKKSITNTIPDVIDVGFHPYGPTLSLEGTLTAEKKVFLIDHISTTIRAPFQSERIEFDWFTLQPHSANQHQSESLKSPSKFVLSPGKPYQYRIMFVDNNRYAEIKSVLVNIVSSWQVMRENNDSQKPWEELLKSFCDSPMTQELNQMLRRLCYWEAGDYSIDITIATKDDLFIARKKFQLHKTEVEVLKNNSLNIIASTCGRTTSSYNIIPATLL